MGSLLKRPILEATEPFGWLLILGGVIKPVERQVSHRGLGGLSGPSLFLS